MGAVRRFLPSRDAQLTQVRWGVAESFSPGAFLVYPAFTKMWGPGIRIRATGRQAARGLPRGGFLAFLTHEAPPAGSIVLPSCA